MEVIVGILAVAFIVLLAMFIESSNNEKKKNNETNEIITDKNILESQKENEKVPLPQATYIIFSTIIIGVLAIACSILFYENSDLKKQAEQNWTQISNLNSTIYNLREDIASYDVHILKLERQVKFMDDYIRICPLDGSGLYHKYGCEKLDTSSSFMAYNVSNAKIAGFSPCSYCSDLDSTSDEKSQIVYVTDTGSKYHRSGCSYLKSKNPITKSKAIEKGYTACSRCNP